MPQKQCKHTHDRQAEKAFLDVHHLQCFIFCSLSCLVLDAEMLKLISNIQGFERFGRKMVHVQTAMYRPEENFIHKFNKH